ncbi:MAG: ribonuclease E, partial [Acidithiobacillus sp.]
RQRLGASLEEASSEPCPRCNGTGQIRGCEATSMHVLRLLYEECMKTGAAEVECQVPVDVAVYLLNEKRRQILELEAKTDTRILIIPTPEMVTPHYQIQRTRVEGGSSRTAPAPGGEGNTLPARPSRPTNESAALSPLTAPPPPEVLPPLRTPPAPSSPKAKAPAKVVPPDEGILARLVRALVSRYVPVDAATFLAETSGAEMSASTEQANEASSDEQECGGEGRSGRRRRRGGRRARARRSTQGGENGAESSSADEEVPEDSYTTEGFQDNDLLAGPEEDSHVLEELVYPGSVPAAADWHQMLVPATTRTPVADLTVESDPAREVESLSVVDPASLTVQEPVKDATPRESLPMAMRQEPTPEPVQGDLLAVEAIEHAGAVSVAVPGEAEQQSFPLGDG